MWGLIFSATFVGNNFHSKYNAERPKKVQRSSRTVLVIYVIFLSKLNFLDRFSKKHSSINFMKIRPVGAELLHADGRTRGSQQSLFAILQTRHKKKQHQ